MHYGGDRRGIKGLVTDGHLGKHNAQREDVTTAIQVFTGDLLRRHIRGRPDYCPRLGESLIGQHVRHPEVHQLDTAIGEQEDVIRFDVPMDDAALMGVLQRLGDLKRDRDGFFRRQRPIALEPGAQRLAAQVLHGDELTAIIGVADLVDHHDAWV